MLKDEAKRVAGEFALGEVDEHGIVLLPPSEFQAYDSRLPPHQVYSTWGTEQPNLAYHGIQLVARSTTNPWIEFAGMFKDDPLFDDWQQAIKDRRKRLDED